MIERILSGASPLWALVNGAARPLKSRGAWRAPCPVISVGNIVAGGVGKTEVTALMARRLVQEGKRVVIALRGYGSQGLPGGQTAGAVHEGFDKSLPDEALVHLIKAPGVSVAVGARRSQVLQRHWEELRPDVILLDDGLQHFAMARDLDAVVHDFSLSAPIWRDFPGILERVSLRIAMSSTADAVRVPAKWAHLPWVRCSYKLRGLAHYHGEEPGALSHSEITGDGAEALPKRALVFCGIGNPQRFLESLRVAGVKVLDAAIFPDHAPYDQARVAALNEWWKSHGGGDLTVLTTLKDYVKLWRHRQFLQFQARAVIVEPQFLENEELFWGAVSAAVGGKPRA